MARAAKWNLFVDRMALRTLDKRMFCLLFLQQVVNVVVAACTNRRFRLLSIGYLGGLVNRMAGHAVCRGKLCLRAVGFMACAAVRDVSMLFGVAVGTRYFGGMTARVILYFTALFRVTEAA